MFLAYEEFFGQNTTHTMKLSIGIVGLPNVGKSTLFNLLTKQQVLAANYPFATIDPNVGVVPVPDLRLKKLTELSQSKKTIPAVVEFYDIAGLVKGAHQGEGLGNQFLSHIRDTSAVAMVLRVFRNPEVIHVEGEPDPVRDLEIVNTELALKDLETVNRRIDKAEGEARTGEKSAIETLGALREVQKCLQKGYFPSEHSENPAVKELQLLTSKKQLYVLNGKEDEVPQELKEHIKKTGGNYVVIDLENPAYDAVALLIRSAYDLLGLVSFFTTGEDETRAWTIERGTKAPQAAGVIHTDFEKKFIRAEVVGYEKLVEAGGWNQAKQKGWMRLEGKEYVVQDGDVIVVRHG